MRGAAWTDESLMLKQKRDDIAGLTPPGDYPEGTDFTKEQIL